MKEIEIEDYLVTHIGNGDFCVKTKAGEIKEAGKNLCGMLRYTYFEDYSLPESDWSVTRKQLLSDYFPKIEKDIINGKIKFK